MLRYLLALLLVMPTTPDLTGYWVGQEAGVNTQTGQHVVRTGIIRFEANGTFVSILKEDDGSGVLATLAPTHGYWQIGQAFGQPVLCATPDQAAFRGSCQPFEISPDGLALQWGTLLMARSDSAHVDAVAPELTRGIDTRYPITPTHPS